MSVCGSLHLCFVCMFACMLLGVILLTCKCLSTILLLISFGNFSNPPAHIRTTRLLVFCAKIFQNMFEVAVLNKSSCLHSHNHWHLIYEHAVLTAILLLPTPLLVMTPLELCVYACVILFWHCTKLFIVKVQYYPLNQNWTNELFIRSRPSQLKCAKHHFSNVRKQEVPHLPPSH